MKKIGILGGIGWPSTMEYYRLICEASQLYHNNKEFSGPIPMPEISIESLNMNFSVNNRGSSQPGSWYKWDSYLNAAIKRLEHSGAELIVIASVTPHGRLNEILEGINVPVVSVYESIGAHCNEKGIKNLLVFGTMPTMNSPAFICGMEEFGVKAFYPPTVELKESLLKVIERLYQGKTDGTSLAINEIARSCISSDLLYNTVICLGCTELPLAFEGFNDMPSFESSGIKYLNSTVVHALAAFKECAK